jgi:hypothetical protein
MKQKEKKDWRGSVSEGLQKKEITPEMEAKIKNILGVGRWHL